MRSPQRPRPTDSRHSPGIAESRCNCDEVASWDEKLDLVAVPGGGNLILMKLATWRLVARFSTIVAVMDSISATIRARIDNTPARTFLRADELAANFDSRNAVDTALSRLADDPAFPLVRVRRGLYWRSSVSKFGKDRPSPTDIVIAVVGDRGGIGPSGWSASRDLGLTSQSPAIEEFATVAPPPTGIKGVVFRRRSNPKRANLRYHEIAAIEVVGAWPAYVDGDWSDVAQAVKDRIHSHEIRPSVLLDAARFEAKPTATRLATLMSAD
jgi:hypothetical protein